MSANITAVEAPDDDVLDDAKFVRGLLFGVAFSLPIWGAIFAVARLLL